MSSASTLVRDVRVFDGAVLSESGWFYRDDNGFAFGSAEPPPAETVIEGGGGYVTPRLFDTHVHGGGGFSAERGAVEMVETLNHHRGYGTGPSLLSLMTDTVENICAQLAAAREVEDALFKGIHLEGPFIADAFKGCHPPSLIAEPTERDLQRILEAGKGVLRSITIAPEKFSPAMIDDIRQSGVVVAVGHTDADYEQARRVLAEPGTVLTHAFNAMRGIHHRMPGPVVAALDEGAFTELIADGHHVHPSVARLLNPHRVILVTDAMSAAGQGDGQYTLGVTEVTVSEGIARDNTGSLAGSTLHMSRAVKNYAEWVDSVELSLTAAITNPALAYQEVPPNLEQEALHWSPSLDIIGTI